MARPFWVLVLVAITLCLDQTALAQNAKQIAIARHGMNCVRCNLFQADLSNLKIIGKNFAQARLRQADVSGAVMTRTKFNSADLRNLNAYGAVLTNADFSRADLSDASFVGAYLEGARFDGAILRSVNFAGAEMKTAHGLTAAQLTSACGDAATRLPDGITLKQCGH